MASSNYLYKNKLKSFKLFEEERSRQLTVKDFEYLALRAFSIEKNTLM